MYGFKFWPNEVGSSQVFSEISLNQSYQITEGLSEAIPLALKRISLNSHHGHH